VKPDLAEMQALVGRLNNLHEIFRVQGEILAHGQECVEPLSGLLLSEPSSFPEPRVAAAECLAAIGGDKAIAALIRVLDYHNLDRLGPVQRFAEETVRNAAARKLSRFVSQTVCDCLLQSLQRTHLIGAGLALADLGDTRAIPYLIECLEDDYKKEKATEALRQFGNIGVPFLCEAIQRPRFVQGVEPPVSRERRCRAAELLGELRAPEAVSALDVGVRDENIEVRIKSSAALVQLGIAKREVLTQLIAGLETEDLMMRNSCSEALQKAGAKAVPLIAAVVGGQAIRVAPSVELRLSLNARLVAIKILGLIPDASATIALINQLNDLDEIVRYRTVAALDNFDVPEVRKALEQLGHKDPSGRVRMRARELLQRSAQKEDDVKAVP
jgi:HEAT repeat protein